MKAETKTEVKVGLKAEAQGQEKVEKEAGEKVCPRCGQPYSYIESYRRGQQTYYVAVHYEGYEKVEGKKRVKKKVRKCYLGPQTYKYVEKLHELGLSGAVDRERFKRYFRELLDEVDLSPRELIAMIEELGSRLLEELDLAEADKDLAERLKGCYQLFMKAYSKVATRLYEERFASRAT
jgi:uncharacterized C2H2 Zn-finger protein